MSSKRVFLSYGHDEYTEFAVALADRLREIGAHVWFDRNSLQASQRWDSQIELGIRECDAFVLLMTPHSVGRAVGVCLDELAFARSLNKRIVPVQVATVPAPLHVVRLHWIDSKLVSLSPTAIQESARAAADQILKAVCAPQRSDTERWSAVLEHLFRSVRIPTQNSMDEVIGRDWIIDNVLDWQRRRTSRGLWIAGGPGTGKTAIARALEARLPGINALHHCRHFDSALNEPGYVILSLAAQLARAWPDYEAALLSEPGLERMEQAEPDALFRVLLCDVPSRLPERGNSANLIIDGLDEANSSRDGLPALLARQIMHLPPSVSLLVTGRDMSTLQGHLGSFDRLVLDTGDPRHLADLEALTRVLLTGKHVNEGTLRMLIARSEGNFLFLRAAIDWLQRHEEKIGLSDFHTLPPGLLGIYADYLERCCYNHNEYDGTLRPVLETLIACRQPPSARMLSEISSVKLYELHDLLDRLGPLLRLEKDTVVPFHKSFLDWLTDPHVNPRYFVDSREGERRIVDAIARPITDVQSWQGYLGTNAVHHLWSIGRIEDIASLAQEDYGDARSTLADLLAADIAAREPGSFSKGFERFVGLDHAFVNSPEVMVVGRRLVDRLVSRRALAHLAALASRAQMGLIGGDVFASYINMRVARAKGMTRQVIQIGASLLPHATILDRETISNIHVYLGDGYREFGQHSEAHRHYVESVTFTDGKGQSQDWFSAASALADLDYVFGDFSLSKQRCLEAISLAGRADLEPGQVLLPLFRVLGNVSYLQKDVPNAQRYYQNTLDIALVGRRPFRELEARNSMAELYIMSSPAAAKRELALARKLAEDHEAWLEYGKSFYIEAQLYLLTANYTLAIDIASEGLELLKRVGYGSGKARCRLVLAEAYMMDGQTSRATGYALDALRYYKSEGIYPAFRLQCLALLSRLGSGQNWHSKEKLEKELMDIPHLGQLPYLQDVLTLLGNPRWRQDT